MDRLKQIIEEINELKGDVTHRSALRICQLLDNNSKLFAGRMDAADFRYVLGNFEAIVNKNPKEFGSADYKHEFEKSYGLLAFHLNKII